MSRRPFADLVEEKGLASYSDLMKKDAKAMLTFEVGAACELGPKCVVGTSWWFVDSTAPNRTLQNIWSWVRQLNLSILLTALVTVAETQMLGHLLLSAATGRAIIPSIAVHSSELPLPISPPQLR
ncbi:hypothetical protein FSHL1_009509 [Fusarium sambucinum]